MGQKGKQPWSRDKLPLGTVRIRKNSKRVKVRMIKVRDDGPKGRRWINLARHWWLTHRGAIAPGMRVVHADGDTLNDDPANYLLVTAGDVAYLARQWDPTVDERNCKASRVATAKCNRERSRVTRARRWLPNRWYPVDVDQKIVINDPQYSRRALITKHSPTRQPSANGGLVVGPYLGWPDVHTALEACILAALATERPATYPQISARVVELRILHGWGPNPKPATYRSAVCSLRSRGFICSDQGRRPRRYMITPAAIAARTDPCPLVITRGREIESRFPGFRKVWPEQYASL